MDFAPWQSDPEAQYRAGFEEGAWALFRQVESDLPQAVRAAVKDWLDRQLDPWRLRSRQEVARGEKPERVLPPSLTVRRSK